MKKYFYGIMLVSGLAMVLAGCTSSGGGYWPATPVSPVTGTQVSPLGGGGNAAAVLFNVPAGGTPVHQAQVLPSPIAIFFPPTELMIPIHQHP